MELLTNRCIIRKFKEEDIDAFLAYHNNEEWMRYQGFKGLTKDEYRNELLGEVDMNEGMQLAIVNKLDDSLVGDIYLRQEDTILWIGYTINPTSSRKGYALETLKQIVQWAKAQGFTLMKAGVELDNKASIGLLNKLGFSFLTKKDDENIYEFKL